MQSERGMTVTVYKPERHPRWGGTDCTNGGESAKVRQFTVVGVKRRGKEFDAEIEPVPSYMQVFAPTEESPAAILVAGAFPGCGPKLVPLSALDKLDGKTMVGPMAGGNLADTSDSRWRELVASFFKDDGIGDSVCLMVSTVDIHDRVETQEQYNALSI